MDYTFESALTIHEIKALYSHSEMSSYLDDPATTARGIAHSTLITARDEGKLVGLIRGVSDMHTLAFIQDLIVLPEYRGKGIGRELLEQFDDYFKSVNRIVIVCSNPELGEFYKQAGFIRSKEANDVTYVRPRQLLEPRF